jgi:hypothetical protein
LCLFLCKTNGSLPSSKQIARRLQNLFKEDFAVELGKQKREASDSALPFCPVTTCSVLGQTCPTTYPCEKCQAAYAACSFNQTASSNETEVCNCYKSAFSCFAATPNCWSYNNDFITTCNTTNTNWGFNCTCGTTLKEPNTTSQCKSNLYCNHTTGICATSKSQGFCEEGDTNECADPTVAIGRTYTCSNSTGTPTCTPTQGWALPGDNCTTSYDCYGAASQCTDHICVGFSEGENCVNSDECDYDLYCSSVNFTCVRRSKLGGPCNPLNNNVDCGSGFVCNLTGSCVSMFSAPSNAICNPNVEWECAYGLICPNIVNATCRLPPAIKACSNDSQCADRGTTCGCALDGTYQCLPTPYSLPQTCATFVQAALSCQNTYQCKSLSDDLQSCTIKHCTHEIDCLFQCMFSAAQTQSAPFTCQTYPTYSCIQATTGNPFTLLTGSPLPTLPAPYAQSNAVSLAISVWLATISAFFMLLS